jgi:hypothetical protein
MLRDPAEAERVTARWPDRESEACCCELGVEARATVRSLVGGSSRLALKDAALGGACRFGDGLLF